MSNLNCVVVEKSVNGVKHVEVKIQHPDNKEGTVSYYAKALKTSDLTTWYVTEVISFDGTEDNEFKMSYKSVFLTSSELIDLMIAWKL